MTHPIVIATDFSPHADEALRYARRFRGEGQPLHLIHVFDGTRPAAYGLTQGQLWRADMADELEAVIHRTLRQAAERCGLDADDLILAHRRRPAAAASVVDYARRMGADLVVVGTHGRRGVRRCLLGSVAEEVVRTAPCDVLAVPLDQLDPWSARPTRHVLIPVDLSPVSASLLARAHVFASRAGAPQREVLHVAEPYPYAWLYPHVPTVPPDVERQLRTEVTTLALRSGAQITPHYAVGSPAHAILKRGAEVRSDLVVLASHDPHRYPLHLLGSVAERVLRAADRPVLVVRVDPVTSRRAPARATRPAGVPSS